MTKSPPFTCSVPLLCSPHWFPLTFRILFKISLLTYKTLREKQPVYLYSMLAASLPSRSLRSNKVISVWVLGLRPTQVQELFTFVLRLFGTTSLCQFSHVSCYLQETSEDTSLTLPVPIDTSTFDGPLMLRNCFCEFAFEHWFGCCATESGLARDISIIEIWLIDWKIHHVTCDVMLYDTIDIFHLSPAQKHNLWCFLL